jgi:signal transduction histidine kinase
MAYRALMRTSDAPGRPARGWRRPAPGWLRWTHASRGDVALALLVGAFQLGFTHVAAHQQLDRAPLDGLAVALLVVGPAALVARRRHPVAVLAVAFAATLAYWLSDYPRGPVFLSLIVALVSVMLSGRRLAAWVALGLGYAAFVWGGWLLGRQPRPNLAAALGVAAWLLVLGTAAEVARTRRERAAEAARTRLEESRRRASEERLRIARELHDVLAHHISLINVQAGVALHLIDERPEQSRTALTAIKQASKDALGELREALDVLRGVDEQAPRSPAPSLGRLDDLASRATAAGIEVRTEVDGDPRPLPAGVDQAAFRIVQEALTNVVRHAGPASATVRVAYGAGALTVQVDDDGASAPGRRAPGGGNGIRGMRERTAALGGQLEAGPRPDGGFRVLARLPLDGPG